MPLLVRDGGVWKDASANTWVRDGGVWKKVKAAFVREAGVWEPIFQGVEMTFIGHNTSALSTITIPATAQAGDLAVLFDASRNNSGGAAPWVLPTGFTLLTQGNVGGASVTFGASFKTIAPGDPGANITGMNGTNSSAKCVFIFRPSSPASFIPNTWSFQGTAGNPAPQTVTALGVEPGLIVFAGQAVQSFDAGLTFSTESPALDNKVGAWSGTQVQLNSGYKIYNSSPVNHTIDMNDVNDNILMSGYIRSEAI